MGFVSVLMVISITKHKLDVLIDAHSTMKIGSKINVIAGKDKVEIKMGFATHLVVPSRFE